MNSCTFVLHTKMLSHSLTRKWSQHPLWVKKNQKYSLEVNLLYKISSFCTKFQRWTIALLFYMERFFVIHQTTLDYNVFLGLYLVVHPSICCHFTTRYEWKFSYLFFQRWSHIFVAGHKIFKIVLRKIWNYYESLKWKVKKVHIKYSYQISY